MDAEEVLGDEDHVLQLGDDFEPVVHELGGPEPVVHAEDVVEALADGALHGDVHVEGDLLVIKYVQVLLEPLRQDVVQRGVELLGAQLDVGRGVQELQEIDVGGDLQLQDL